MSIAEFQQEASHLAHMREQQEEAEKDIGVVYKVTKRSSENDTPHSCVVSESSKLSTDYPPEVWVEPLYGPALAFNHHAYALDFSHGVENEWDLTEVWKAEAEKIRECQWVHTMRTPFFSETTARIFWEHWKKGWPSGGDTMGTPEGTVAVKRIRLIERIKP